MRPLWQNALTSIVTVKHDILKRGETSMGIPSPGRLSLPGALEIDAIIDSVLKYRKPARILVFGSRARGDSTPQSDIDICVLFDHLPDRTLTVIQDLYRHLYEVETNPIDLVVYEESAFLQKAGKPGSFEARIKNEGVVVYGQP